MKCQEMAWIGSVGVFSSLRRIQNLFRDNPADFLDLPDSNQGLIARDFKKPLVELSGELCLAFMLENIDWSSGDLLASVSALTELICCDSSYSAENLCLQIASVAAPMADHVDG
jgi:hypothetical protein